MITSTKGIVIKTNKYSESSMVVQIYTEAFGLRSYIVKGLGSRKNRNSKTAMFQPLSLLELQVYNKENKSLNYIKELKTDYVYRSIPYDIKKSSILIFINELLYLSVREEEANPTLFSFLRNFLVEFDSISDFSSDIHLLFMLELSKYLGFSPSIQSIDGGQYFDLQEGVFCFDKPLHNYYIDPELSGFLKSLLSGNNKIKYSRKERSSLLDALTDYYRLHLSGMKEMKSVQVLKQLFD